MSLRQLAAVAVVVSLAGFVAMPTNLARAQESVLARFATGSLRPAVIHAGNAQRRVPGLSGGVVTSAQDALASTRVGTRAVQSSAGGLLTLGCSQRSAGNGIRVNQDCTFRRQAEETIAINPRSPANLIAGQNDTRTGFNRCAFDYSFNGGAFWGDGIPPFYGRLNAPPAGHSISGGSGTGHTYDAASDPAVTFDSEGRAFFTCVLFDINDNASALLMGVSPVASGGAFYENVPAEGSAYVVDEENQSSAGLDKEFIRADSYTNSPYRDNVYIVFTRFDMEDGCPAGGGYCSSPIYFARSTDHGVTWSAPVEISGNSPNLCSYGDVFDPRRSPSDCDVDQGADIQVLPNGKIAVVYNNWNTPANDPNHQQLAVVSVDGGRSFGPPVLVGQDISSAEPWCELVDAETCIPGQYSRTDDYPRLAVDRSNGKLYSVWQDYRGDRFGLVMSSSMDGGAHWTESTPFVNDGMDDSQAAIDVSPVNHTIAVSYYATPRVPNEDDVCDGAVEPCDPSSPGVGAENSTYRLAWMHSPTGPAAGQALAKPFVAPNGSQLGFMGDYSGIAVTGTVAHPIWSSTAVTVPLELRESSGVINDQDIYSTSLVLP